ncbi:hypothetical protein CC79DRAFT_1365798 [Sarocladium strictum]
MADPHQDAFLKRRLTSKQVNLKDSQHDQRCFARLMFPKWLPQFKDPNDRTGIYTPAAIYRSYLAAVWEELWAFDKERHMMQDVEDLADVVDIVRNNFTSSREDLIQKITAYAVTRDRAVQGEKVAASLELAVQVWLLADFQTDSRRLGNKPPGPERPWHATESLCQQLRATIRDDEYELIDTGGYLHRRFSPRFTLYDMARLSLIEIEWTNNIAKHLLLEEWRDRRYVYTIHIFTHATLLDTLAYDIEALTVGTAAPVSSATSQVHNVTVAGNASPTGCGSNGGSDAASNISSGSAINMTHTPAMGTEQPTPDEDLEALIRETLDTLDLLLRLEDPECLAWYNKIQKKSNKQRKKEKVPLHALDSYAGSPDRPGSLARHKPSQLRRVGHYKIWRQRLLKLELAFNKNEPADLKGWWKDRRRKSYWATFLSAIIAIGIAVFAVIVAFGSIATGGMSVDLAKKANHLAEQDLQEDFSASSDLGTGGMVHHTVTIQGCCECKGCADSRSEDGSSSSWTRTFQETEIGAEMTEEAVFGTGTADDLIGTSSCTTTAEWD